MCFSTLLLTVAPSWDVENPEEISLPCLEPSDHDEVKCIAQVGDRIWVGVGSRIFFLNADNPSSREVYVRLCGCRIAGNLVH